MGLSTFTGSTHQGHASQVKLAWQESFLQWIAAGNTKSKQTSELRITKFLNKKKVKQKVLTVQQDYQNQTGYTELHKVENK